MTGPPDSLAALFRPLGVEHFGVCRYADCLPPLPCRGAARLPEDTRSVVVCLFPWYAGEYSPRNAARYAVPDDYHRIAGGILREAARGLSELYPGEGFVPFADSSPIREVRAAAMAGLGIAGRNGLLLHPDYGNRVFIGEIVTTLALPPAPPKAGRCLDCGACAAACPTGALTGGGLDRSLCRSAITQKKGALTPWEAEQIAAGGLVWGCDRCADACPLNTDKRTPIRAFWENPAPLVTAETLDDLLRTKAYGYRGREVLRRNLQIINGS